VDKSDSSEKILLIFLKNNEQGKVKTRLAKTLGDEKALEVYKKLKAFTFAIADKVEADKQLWFSNFLPDKSSIPLKKFQIKLQKGHSLGERMKLGFQQAFEDGYKKAVIIGSDCAQLQQEHLQKAYAALDSTDVVIGPAQDGGYYLLGMRTYLPNLFNDIDWSSERVFKQTVAKIIQGGNTYSTLETLNDVDTEADWHEVKDKLH